MPPSLLPLNVQQRQLKRRSVIELSRVNARLMNASTK
jgi:hypothetical protein